MLEDEASVRGEVTDANQHGGFQVDGIVGRVKKDQIELTAIEGGNVTLRAATVDLRELVAEV